MTSFFVATPKQDGPIQIPILTASGKIENLNLSAFRGEVVDIVNQSGSMAGFRSSESWAVFWRTFSEKMDLLEKKIERLPELQKATLEQHDSEREREERRLSNRFKKICEDILNPSTWFWMIVSALVGAMIVYLVFGHI